MLFKPEVSPCALLGAKVGRPGAGGALGRGCVSALSAVATNQYPGGKERLELGKLALELKRKGLGGDKPELQLDYSNLGSGYVYAREYAPALENLQKALSLATQRWGPDHPTTSYPLSNLGALELVERGPSAQAEQYLLDALRIRENKLGKTNLRTLKTLGLLCELYLARGEHARARESLQQTLEEMLKTRPGTDLEHYFELLLAQALRAQNRFPDALALERRACALGETLMAPEDPERWKCHAELGQTLLQLGKSAEAWAEYQRMLSALENPRREPFDHPYGQKLLGDWYLVSGRPADALPYYEAALKPYEARLGPAHLDVGKVLLSIGKARVALKQYTLAQASLERVVIILPKANLAPELQAEARYALARALSGAGGDAARSRTLATQAVEDFQRSEAHDRARRVEEIRRWLGRQR